MGEFGRKVPPRKTEHMTHPQTLAVTAGRPAKAPHAPFSVPVVFASTYVGSADTSDASVNYGRDGNPTWLALEEAIGALEGGRAMTFASGMAASHAVLELIEPGAVVVLPRHCYQGLSGAAEERAVRYGWTLRRVDIVDTEAVLAAADGADLVWMESPTNPMMETADLPRLGAELPASVTFVVDNTFATPLLQQPLSTGADIVVHSATKMISGHSDVLLGAVVTRDEAAYERLSHFRHSFGAIPGPMEAYLALRGLRTLPLRLAQAQASAQVLAERLAKHPRVCGVRFPGLPTDPGHQRARDTMSGFGSLLCAEFADAATADAVVEACRLWVFATSLGGVESTLERRRRWATETPSVPEGLVRLSVGIEHVGDLWADLAQALDALPAA